MRRRNRRQGQGTVEFSLVLPVFLLIVFGAIYAFIWQLDIDSAQFGALEGAQAAGLPSVTGGPTGLRCQAADRAYNALTKESFLGPGTPALTPISFSKLDSAPCTLGHISRYVCPEDSAGNPVRPTYNNMLSILGNPAYVSSATVNGVLICAWTNPANPTNTQSVELLVTIVGFKPAPVKLPVGLTRLPFYGQNSQTLQEFTQ